MQKSSRDSKEEIKPAPINRVYGNQQEFDSDTFKLELATFQKNISWNDKNPILEPVEHCHFFHTFDSNGKRCDRSCRVGGHYHNVVVKVNEEGQLIGESGPAIGGLPTDRHIHTVRYIKSDIVKLRRYSPEALKSIDQFERIQSV